MKIKKKGDGYYLVNGKYHWSETDENTLFITEIPLKKWTRDYSNLLRQLMGIEIIEDNDKNENFKIQNSINLNSENNLPKDDFSKYIFEHINKIRKNPKEFIEIIEESKSNIKIDKKGKLIFKHKVKVALSEGEPVFNEAISILERTTQMNELIFNPNICVPIPDNENDIKSKNYLNEKIEEIKQNYPISSYWRDIITDPETSFILMIVDDSSKKTRIKRNDILNPDYKYIGICSVTIGKTFGCYVTFSK